MDKIDFAAIVVVVCGAILGGGMLTGHDGVLMASVMTIIGGVAGAVLGFSIGIKKS